MPEPAPNVDGIGPSQESPEETGGPAAEQKKNAAVLSRARFALITMIGMPYLIYMFWSFFLLAVLPDASGEWDSLIPFAKLLAMIVGIAFVLGSLFAVMRVGKAAGASDRVRYMSFARIGAIALPALLMSGFVPYWITQEPPLTLYVSSPAPGTDLVAPISISYDASDAVEIMERQGLTTKLFNWDFNGDGKFDLESVTPEGTAYYDRQGAYNVSVTLQMSDGSKRTVRRRLVIPQAVFSYTPFIPVVDEPIKFSVAHLIPELDDFAVRDVQWDFDQDGIPDEVSTELETSHTFLRTGPQRVAVTIFFTNQTQNTYVRILDIQEPKPNPFPVDIETTPAFLESPPPFQVVFRIVSDEELQEVTWDFDDGSPEEIGDRVGHTFRNRKVYQVKARARNFNGEISKVTKVVKVVENLSIPDLSFDGTHTVNGDTIRAEAPVAITLTPKTTMPLVDFWWEAPEKASQVTSTDTTLKAIFRDEGTYNLVLLAKDAEGRVMRKIIKLEVQPKSQNVTFQVRPEQAVAPEIVQFDASLSRIPGEVITGFLWNFGDTESEEFKFGDAFEEHEYTQPGQYTVTLMVNTLSGRSELARKTIVVRAPFLKACFTMSRNRIKEMQGILFKWECSTGSPTRIEWDFGDNAFAESDPADAKREIDHLFEEAGQYKVKLTMDDANGSTSEYIQDVFVEPK